MASTLRQFTNPANTCESKQEADETKGNHDEARTVAMTELLRERVDDCRVNCVDNGELECSKECQKQSPLNYINIVQGKGTKETTSHLPTFLI